MRPIIDTTGARLVDANGHDVPGVRSFTVVVDFEGVIIVKDVEIIATDSDGEPVRCRSGDS